MKVDIAELAQLHNNGPELTPVGDCYRTSLASLLGFSSPDKVPHFVQMAHDAFGKEGLAPEPMWAREWMRDLGYDLAAIGLDDCKAWCKETEMDLYGLATVPGHNAKWHCVVWDVRASNIRWDPSTCTSRELDEDLISEGFLEIACLKYEPGPETMTRQPNAWPAAMPVKPLVDPWVIGLD